MSSSFSGPVRSTSTATTACEVGEGQVTLMIKNYEELIQKKQHRVSVQHSSETSRVTASTESLKTNLKVSNSTQAEISNSKMRTVIVAVLGGFVGYTWCAVHKWSETYSRISVLESAINEERQRVQALRTLLVLTAVKCVECEVHLLDESSRLPKETT